MAKATFRIAVLGLFLSALAPRAEAYPFLQLDLLGGVYDADPEEQTIVAPDGPFTLFAILTPQDSKPIDFSLKYYISVALLPSFSTQPSPAPSLGSFTFGGSLVNVTSDMTYGVPPVEDITAMQGWDQKDLSKHSIFPTYFKEFVFTFSSLNQVASYNAQDNPGGPSAGTGAYAVSFTGDSSLLASPYTLHFDLYSKKFKDCANSICGDVDRDQFAPFSHDAELRRVPEPGSLTLLGSGLGLLAAATVRRRRTRKA